MFFWFYKRGFNPLKNNQNPIDVRALKMPRFYCNHTAFLTSRLYFRTIAQCKFWEWHNRSAYAAKFFHRLHASEFVLLNRKKKLLSIYREKSCAPPIKQHLFVAIDEKYFLPQADIQQKYSTAPYKIKLPATPVCTLISEILF